MSAANFSVTVHNVPGQHLREYTQGAADESYRPLLEVKQYVPLDNRQPGPDDVTIIAAGGIGFIKELYEPLFDDILAASAQHGFKIRAIWSADMYCVGKSALLNEGYLGNHNNWWDHSRDLLCVINHFSKQMPRPLVGLGHSMGAAQIAYLSTLHPRLFSSLIMLEPAIYKGLQRKQSLQQAKGMSRRREVYESMETAEAAVRRSPFYKRWDPRAVQALLDNAYIRADPGCGSKEVKISTPKHAEVALIFKPNFRAVGVDGLENATVEDRMDVPDVHPEAIWKFPFYRPEPPDMFFKLPQLRPTVLYIIGSDSPSSYPEIREDRLQITGSGPGGSGGVRLGRVREVILDGGQHTLPMDGHLPQVAAASSQWLGEQMKEWRQGSGRLKKEWEAKPAEEKDKVDRISIETFLEYDGKKSLEDVALDKLGADGDVARSKL